MWSLVKVVLLFFFAAAAVLASENGRSIIPQDGTESFPVGWRVYNPDNLSPTQLQCLNLLRNSWRVSVETGQIQVTKIVPQSTPKADLPADFNLKPELAPGRRSVLRFADNWLIGLDAGEWGGGLWVTNEDGSKNRQIVMDNIRGLIPAGHDVYVLAGLVHMSADFGYALKLSNPHGLDTSLKWVTQLEASPHAFLKREDGSLLVATRYGVTQIEPSGASKKLFWLTQFRGYILWVNSIAEAPNGIIYLGTNAFVLRFRPTSTRNTQTFSNYDVTWFLPAKCDSPCNCKL